MIAWLEGTVTLGGDNWIILKVGGVGYKVYPIGFFPQSGDVCSMYIHHFIREDRQDLFGCETKSVLEIFERLVEISGVGPKLAQKILYGGDVEKIRGHIAKGDVGFLTSISGVGKKTAQKIILELKGVLVSGDETAVEDVDTLEALIGLGYQRRDVLEVLQQVEGDSTESRIRSALKLLSK